MLTLGPKTASKIEKSKCGLHLEPAKRTLPLTTIQDANGHSTTFTYDAFGRVTASNFPSTLTETYAYDANNNLTSKTDRKGNTITYAYDRMNRLTSKSYPDSTSVAYTYDKASRLTEVSDPTGTYDFTFDNMGPLVSTTTNYSFLTGRSFTTSYSYDAGCGLYLEPAITNKPYRLHRSGKWLDHVCV